ncbi:MAG: hypothetical protein P4L40_21170 [Terracidiphilus sp.]|nr:hypothetical protein [Terracidiphilus sp.]
MKRKAKFILGAVVAVSGACALGLAAIWFAYTRNACQTEARLTIDDPAGLVFEVVDESCDTLAKDEAISVYAKKAVSKGTWRFFGRRSQRTLLFRYDPGRPDNPLPSIKLLSQTTILISIPEVSSIVYQNRKWENMSVNYEIGKVDYPPKSK